MFDKIKIGKYGQNLAVKFLLKRDYLILEENYYSRQGEVDIIAQKNKQLVFVEVKTRTSLNYGLPEESLTASKRKKLEETAFHYLSEKQIDHDNFRLDCVAILLDLEKQKAQITHHKAI